MPSFFPKSFHRTAFYFVGFILTAALFPANSSKAQDASWQKAIVYPGSEKIFTANAEFPDCWERNVNNYDIWHNCKDEHWKTTLKWETIADKVTRNYEFTITSPGYCTYVFETHVPEKVFYHQEASFSVSFLGEDGKWQSTWIAPFIHYEHYLGKKLHDKSGEFTYQIKPDGTLRFWTVPPLYKPGKYKITIVAAKRVGAYDLAYVQGSAKLDVYFIGEDLKVSGKQNNKITDTYVFGKNWHVNNDIKIGLARIVDYLRRRSSELAQTKPSMSSLFNTYADRITKATFYYNDKSEGGEASTSFLNNITLYKSLVNSYTPFFGKNQICEDKDYGIVASIIMHEIAHSYGANEWQAHYLQKLTFDDLKVSKTAGARVFNKKFFKKYPENTIWAQFYRWTIK